MRLGKHVVLVEQIDGEAANLVGQVAARFVVDAAHLRAQLNGLGDLVPIACDGIELVHVWLDGGFPRVSMVSGGLDELAYVLALLLQDTLGFHLVTIYEVIDQPGRMNLTAGGQTSHGVGHHFDERHRRQPVERIFDGSPVVPLALGQFGLNLIKRIHLGKTGCDAIFIDVAQNLIRGQLLGEVGCLHNELGQVIRIVLAIHSFERGGQQV